MQFLSRQVRHLTRYVILLGLLAFAAYWYRLSDFLTFFLLGPSIYCAFWIRSLLASYLLLPGSEAFTNSAFLLPVTFVYFAFIGFQFKQLWGEKGSVRLLTVLALLAFLTYIHLTAQQNLLAYFQTPFPDVFQR